MINRCNDLELAKWREIVRQTHAELDLLMAEGREDALWITLHRLTNAGEQMKERLNRIKYDKKEKNETPHPTGARAAA